MEGWSGRGRVYRVMVGLVAGLLCVVADHIPVHGSVVEDREVLVALFRSTGGTTWSNRTNWLSAEPLSEWHGVVTDGSGRVTSLALSRNGLKGRIPPELGQLSQLQGLYLGENELSGPIPPELGHLTNLLELLLERNELIGTIPLELGGLTRLQGLYLGRNHLSGRVPLELGGLTSLKWLSLRGNRLSGTIPPGLRKLPLSTLDLMATSVCVPGDVEYREWLAAIEFYPSGLTCGHPPAAMSFVDIAVVYTQAARKTAGGTAEMEALIDLMIAETNQAYLDSEVNQRLVLVAREEVQYSESGNANKDLRRLADPSDGHIDEVHTIRDQAGADLVHMVTGMTDLAGIAQLLGAFSLTRADSGSEVFAHELGHNMGLRHDHGYVNQRGLAAGAPKSARWRTIMAHGSQCVYCDWVLRFSNPKQTYLGDRLGLSDDARTSAVTGPADAVGALNITRHSVASIRPRSSGNRLTMYDAVLQAPPMMRPAPLDPAGSLFRRPAPNARGTSSRRAGVDLERGTLRWREVSVDIGRLARAPVAGSTALRLNLFGNVVLTGIIERRTPTCSGGYVLSGRLTGEEEGRVTLVVNGSVMAGTVRMPGATYRIRPFGAGRHAILQIDPSWFPERGVPVSLPTARVR